MATLEQAPPGAPGLIPDITPSSPPDTAVSPFNSLLARAYTLNWEAIFYIALFVAAILSRFVNLGDRVASHDESLHMQYSWNLWKKGEFIHTPLMHGPVLFHMVALSYFLFGDGDFQARIYPALLGVIMIMMPKLLFERWLGKRGAMVSSVLILISPMLLFHARYIREDTPSIFFTILMVYSIFAYIDGAQPRKIRFLILLSAATLLSLASKETGFMYVAIFGAVLTLFWLFQVAQGIRAGFTKPLAGQIIAGVIGVIILVVVSLALGAFLSDKLAALTGAQVSGRILALPIAVIGLVIGFALVSPLRNWFTRLPLYGNSFFRLVMAGIMLGTIAALAMTCILSIIPTSDIWKTTTPPVTAAVAPGTSSAAPAAPVAAAPPVVTVDQNLLSRLIIWVTMLALILALVVIVTALIRFAKSPRLPWSDVILVILVAVLTCTMLVYFEEKSKNVPNTSVDSTSSASVTGVRHNEWIVGAWVVAAAAFIGVLALRFATTFFDDMKRYAVFDVLIILGTLILPWLSALPIFLAGYPLDDPNLTAETLNACIIGTIPFVILAITVGLCWNPKFWIVCAVTFYCIFIFFYTTIFTNINGWATGLVESLGYWLVQQGVRRGSQPQYYYLLVEIPIYEYLPAIGAMVAGVVGMFSLWRFRSDRLNEVAELEQANAAAAEALAYHPTDDLSGEMAGEITSDPSDAAIHAATDPQVTQASAYRDTIYTSADTPAESVAGTSATLPEPTDESLVGDAPIEGITDEVLPPDPDVVYWQNRKTIREAEWLDRMPFLGFVGVWAVLLTMAFTIAGEKMPWLTTHLTVPMIFLTGWYVGTILDKVDWKAFWQRSWGLILLFPIIVIAFANVVGPFIFSNGPFGSLTRDDLSKTFTWFGAIMLTVFVGWIIYRIWKQITTRQFVQMLVLGVFAFLAVLTARTAWTAAYIDYDYATEFLVYAHSSPNYRFVMNTISDIAQRTGEGVNVKVAYDNLVSWPGSWYFRNYAGGDFKGDMSGMTDLDTYDAIVVGEGNNAKVQSQLGDKYYQYHLSRMWWPMQDYFDLNTSRIDNVFAPGTPAGDQSSQPAGWVDGPTLRQGLWDIWWNRDYTAYGTATGKDFDVSKWPVTDWMYFYVRKDIAAQIWDFGTGGSTATTTPVDVFQNLRCDTCSADTVIGAQGDQAGQLNHPRGMSVGPDGNLYVADSLNTRIAIFDPNGKFIRQFGIPGSVDSGNAPGGSFREPWGVAVGTDGTIYVADTWNHRVEVFDNSGKYLRGWGEFEQVPPNEAGKPDGFWGPRDIAVDAQNHVYIADTGNKRIRVYDSQGKFLYDIGAPGASLGQLDEPVGIAINSQTNEIFVADTWNSRIDVYDLTGNYRRSWGVQAWGATKDTGSRPYMTLDSTGTRLFVTDPDAGRVLVFDTNGVPLLTFGTLATDNNYSTTNFGILGGITMDKNNDLFLADSGAGHILRLRPDTFPGLVPAEVKPASPQASPEDSGVLF